jgi:hypothetical protein
MGTNCGDLKSASMNKLRERAIHSTTGFLIVPVHYTDDPEKTSAEWKIAEQNKYKREAVDWQRIWDREMELDFTAVSGSPGYPNFREVNLRDNLVISEQLPICLCCDFNVEPMIWEIAQIVPVEGDRIPCFIDEIMMSPGTIDEMVNEFRNRYPAHPCEVWIYGDSTGAARSTLTTMNRSAYDLIRLAFRGYASPVRFKVPPKNPDQRDRLNAFNLRLRDPDGMARCFIHRTKCPQLLKDFREVVTKEDGTKIVKVTKRENPYFWRTHASDAAGYFIYREWPVVREVLRALPRRHRPPRNYRRILGEW